MKWSNPFTINEEPGKPVPKAAYGWRIYIVSIVAALSAAGMGYDTAFIGGTLALPGFQQAFNLNPDTKTRLSANIVSALIAGIFLGCVLAYPLAERLGRKPCMLVACVVTAIGTLLQLLADGRTAQLYAGRVVTGLGLGPQIIVVPVYLAECAPAPIRGRLVGIMEVFGIGAQVVGYWINYAVQKHLPPSNAQWRIPVSIQLVPAVLVLLAAYFMVESPRWLVSRGRIEEATARLACIRQLPPTHEYVRWEVDNVIEQLGGELHACLTVKRAVVVRFKQLFAKGMRRRVGLALLMRVANSLTGVPIITLYSSISFPDLGVDTANDTLLSTGIFGVVKFTSALIFLLLCVDSVGRRTMLVVGSILTSLCFFYLGAYCVIGKTFTTSAAPSPAALNSALAAIYLFAVAYSFSWAVIPCIFTAEIFPTHLRALAMALATAFSCIVAFGVNYAIPYMLRDWQAGTFFFFASATLVNTVLVFAAVPETKALKLEDMDVLFAQTRWAPRAMVQAREVLRERREELALDGVSVSVVESPPPEIEEKTCSGTHVEVLGA